MRQFKASKDTSHMCLTYYWEKPQPLKNSFYTFLLSSLVPPHKDFRTYLHLPNRHLLHAEQTHFSNLSAYICKREYASALCQHHLFHLRYHNLTLYDICNLQFPLNTFKFPQISWLAHLQHFSILNVLQNHRFFFNGSFPCFFFFFFRILPIVI